MFTIIAAVGKDFSLGKKGNLIWHLKEDMKFFRKTTSGHTVIMGRKTFESLGGLLPDRHHIVLTNNKKYAVEKVEIFHSPEEIYKKYKSSKEECFIIGGGAVYNLFLPLCDRMYLTFIDAECPDADTFFPEFDKSQFSSEILSEIEENGVYAKIIKFERKKDFQNI